MRIILGGLAVTATLAVGLAAQQPKSGLSLGTLTWRDAETALTPSTVVVLPLGAASLEHGPHMKLDSSDRLARYLGERVRTVSDRSEDTGPCCCNCQFAPVTTAGAVV